MVSRKRDENPKLVGFLIHLEQGVTVYISALKQSSHKTLLKEHNTI